MRGKNFYVTVGIPLSGKTTYALDFVEKRRLAGDRISYTSFDDVRERILTDRFYKSEIDNVTEGVISRIVRNEISELLKIGDVILDATTLHPNDFVRYRDFAETVGVNLIYKILEPPTPVEIVKRNNKRLLETGKYIPERVIRRFLKQFKLLVTESEVENYYHCNNIKIDKRITNKTNQPIAEGSYIMVDLDGTLALMNGRNIYAGADCGTDVVNHSVKSLLDLYDGRVLIVSGRNSSHGGLEATIKWLADNDIKYESLFMRPEYDNHSPDTYIKENIYRRFIEPNYNVSFVLDDRNVVVDLWRNKFNLNCFQVFYGDF